jgi:hypothetical protein
MSAVEKAGELIDHIKICVQEHNATPHTPIYIRDGAAGPMKRISQVKMMKDDRGLAIILETSTILLS